MQCGELSRCGWLLPLRVDELLADGERAVEFNERSAAHALRRHEQLLHDLERGELEEIWRRSGGDVEELRRTEDMSSSTPCNHVTNAFFLDQMNQKNNRSEVPADVFALEEAMRQMFTRAGARYLAALDTRINPAILGPPSDVVTWASILSDDECHPEHEHVEGGELITGIDGEDAPLLSAVYYPSASADENAPLVFFDPRGGDAKAPSPRFVTSDGCTSLGPSSVAAPSQARGPLGEPDPPVTERARLAFRPTTGDVIVFPGWLRHGVPPIVGQWNATRTQSSSGHHGRRRVAYAANLVLSKQRFALKHGRIPSVRDLRAAGVPSFLLEGPCEERGGWGAW